MAATGAPWLPLPLPHFTPPTQTQVPVGGETVNYLVIDSILPPHPPPTQAEQGLATWANHTPGLAFATLAAARRALRGEGSVRGGTLRAASL